MDVLMEGIVFGESPRWRDGRVWFSDWGAHEVIALDPDGTHEVVARVPSIPLCFDFLPDGDLLMVDSAHRRLLRRTGDGTLVTHADLSPISTMPWNDIVVDARGNAYVNNIGFEFPGGEPALGLVAIVGADGRAAVVAQDLVFPNGMAITEDGCTLIVAESHANRLTAFDIGPGGELGRRHVWADTGGDFPDGICIDAEGAVWYADVPNRHCVRMREGGQVLDTVELDRGAFACILGRDDDPHLYVVGQHYGDTDLSGPTGFLVAVGVSAGGAGRP